MKKCPVCKGPMTAGGCFQTVYWHCKKCEEADTEPMTDPGFQTPTSPLPVQTDWKWPAKLDGHFYTSPFGRDRIQCGFKDVWVSKVKSPTFATPVEVRGPVLEVGSTGHYRVATADCKL